MCTIFGSRLTCFGGICEPNAASASAGTITQILAVGQMDQFLTGDPPLGPNGEILELKITFFRAKTKRYTNFAIEIYETSIPTAAFGGEVCVEVPRHADLMMMPVVHVVLPQIRPNNPLLDQMCSPNSQQYASHSFVEEGSTQPACGMGCACDEDVPDEIRELYDCDADPAASDYQLCCGELLPPRWVTWIQGAGAAILQRVQLFISGQCVDYYQGESIYAWEEVCGKPGKDLYQCLSIKKSLHELILQSAIGATELYIPLMFFMSEPSLALPLCSLQFAQVDIKMSIAPRCAMVARSDNAVCPIVNDHGGFLGNGDIRMSLIQHNIYLDLEERDIFAKTGFTMIIHQHQHHNVTIKNSTSIEFEVPFNHPVSAMVLTASRKYQRDVGNFFNFSGPAGKPILQLWTLNINNMLRFQQRESYFRLIQPYFFGTKTTRAFVYLFSFGLSCSGVQSNGSLNFSRVDTCRMILDLAPRYGTETVYVAINVRNYNLLKFCKGIAGVQFT